MKAIVYRTYGSPAVLKFEEIEKPTPAHNEVLLKVHAASVNSCDWQFMRGLPYLIRLFAGLTKPKVTRLGTDVAGRVEAVGSSVTQFKPGDAVFGTAQGAFAEYVCTPESRLALKPENVTFEQAASLPIAACTALMGLRDKGHIKAGQQVLINGAAGGVGTFALQIARLYGAVVTAVCSATDAAMVLSIGADHVIDYTQEDSTRSGQRYDLILDAMGNRSVPAIKRALKPYGIAVMAGGSASRWMIGTLARAIRARVWSQFGTRRFGGMQARIDKEDLATLHELMTVGKIQPVIEKCYPLSDVPDAVRHVEEGRARGKVVITFEELLPQE
jgi:NADPH:quinone reductase-like Zn-dependent oxidoreductase